MMRKTSRSAKDASHVPTSLVAEALTKVSTALQAQPHLVTESEPVPEEILRLLGRSFSIAEVGLVITDVCLPDNPIIYHSATFEHITGYTADEIRGKNCRFLQGPDTDPAAAEEIHFALERERPCRITLLNYRRDGTPFWNDLALSPVRDAEGRLTHYVGVQHDITAQKETATALRESEARFRPAFDESAVAMAMASADGRLLRVNEAYCRLVGHSQKEMLRLGIAGITHPEDAEEHRRRRSLALALALALAGESPSYRMEMRFRHKEGQILWVEVISTMVRDSAGSLLYSLGQILDITERKRAEENLRKSEHEQRELARMLEKKSASLAEAQAVAKMGSWELDLEINTLTWSEEMYRIFGVDRETFGSSYEAFLERLPPEDGAAVDKAYTESLANHTPYFIEHRIRRDDGSYRVVQEHCQTFYDDQGQPIRSVGTTQDITERKRLEQQVIHSAKLAALGALMAGVAHEINNPLAAISGLAQLLKRHPEKQVQDDATIIDDMAQRASRIVRILRSYTRVGGGNERKPGDLNTVAASAMDIVAFKLRQGDVSLELNFGVDLPPVLMNASEIEQVLVNLLSNAEYAVRACPEGERLIRVTTRVVIKGVPEGEPGNITDRVAGRCPSCIVEVYDSGFGISAATVEHLFDPFFTTKETGEGTGLGLYISHGIITAHGGTIEVGNPDPVKPIEDCRGTTFRITLPAVNDVQ